MVGPADTPPGIVMESGLDRTPDIPHIDFELFEPAILHLPRWEICSGVESVATVAPLRDVLSLHGTPVPPVRPTLMGRITYLGGTNANLRLGIPLVTRFRPVFASTVVPIRRIARMLASNPPPSRARTVPLPPMVPRGALPLMVARCQQLVLHVEIGLIAMAD